MKCRPCVRYAVAGVWCFRALVSRVLSLILSHYCVKYEHGAVLPRARVTGPRLAAKATREQPPILEENL